MHKAVLMLSVALAVGGCSNSAHQPDLQQFQGRYFTLTAVDGKPVDTHPGLRPGIAFSSDLRVSGVMCNRFFGQGQIVGNRLSVPQLASTRMLCSDAELNQWEQTLTALLSSGASVAYSGQTLTLEGQGHVLVYQLRAE